ncbi:thiol:disulfide interchange protein DsbD [Litorivivens lipolytica]|uniref:Thiol:disulfide interchange protein DsbD n=1 Tax=Litorivivens lipolytica TaxID=1524264 RepID=A0A7W4W635_9GAMM|nr:protein-disulfide reductase DsbD domain-containing protein [Litorivivens lipolytica]MBB3048156.1 thiol:disulfide interchange protein DsbD [Litorivivens lipolytica]
MRYFLQFTLLWLSTLCAAPALSNAFSDFASDSPFAEETTQFLPVTEAYQPLVSLSDGALEVNWQITEAYYLYQQQFAALWQGASNKGSLELNYGQAEIKDDPYFGETPVYYNFANARIALPDSSDFLLKLTAQGCADAGLCYPPHDWFFRVDIASASVQAVDEARWQAVSSGQEPPLERNSSLWLMLLFALAGGAILNLMPCVFPVLGLKVLSFAQSPSGTAARHGAIYSLGVISSFLAVAAALIAVKSAGAAVGWGFQLQTPWFVALLSCIFFLLSLNLLGLFEIRLPGNVPGQALSQRNDYTGSFFTGVLATIVATPCTAPFMGTALGFAATQPAATALLVFAALGLGMALPVYLLTLYPRALKALPRSGKWMDHLKQFLSFPLLATAIWLCWVTGRQVGSDGMGATLLAWLALGLAVWCWRLRGRIAGLIALLLLGIAVALVFSPPITSANTAALGATSDDQIVYSRSTVDALRAEGRPVLVDVTADWCITCKVNEAVALHTPAVEAAFERHNLAYVVADWTRYDEHITALLSEYQRNGIPLYLLYVPGEDRARILPQILTEGLILDALETLKPAP